MLMNVGRKLMMNIISKNLTLARAIQSTSSTKQIEVAASLDRNDVDVEYASAKPFDSIPGPKPLPIPHIGNMWRMLPFGTYGKMDLLQLQKRLNKEYGPIVRFSGLGSFSHVILFDPVLAEKMHRNESMRPRRYSLPSMKYYREVLRKDFYQNTPGLLVSNGDEWYEFRTTTNQVMLKPQNVTIYLDSVEEVCNDFLERIRFIRKPNHEMPEDFFHEINKLSLETFMFMTLDTRLGCLKNDLRADSEAAKMIENVRSVFQLMEDLDLRPSLWKVYPTKDWKKFVKANDFLVEFTNKHITAKWDKIKNQSENDSSKNRSILESLLLNTKDPKIAVVMASDTLFAAIDTTSSTMASALYFLSTNPDKQEILYQELKGLLPKKDSKITHEILNQLKYTRAVIKETLRLASPAAGNQRETTKDIVFANYQIPKGTTVMVGNSIMCKHDKHFKDSNDFKPERWLKSESQSEFSYKNVNPFVYMPFGFGQRSCIGKRFAYLEMDVVISKIVRNFKITYNHEPMTWATKLITLPNKPLKFKMMERSE